MLEPALIQNPTQNQPSLNPKGKTKFVLYGLILLLLALGLSVLMWFSHHKQAENSGKVLANKDRHLSAEAKKIYQDRVQKAQDDLKALSSNDPKYLTIQINDHIYLAQQFFGLGEMEKSKQEYLVALQFDPNYESALVGLALTYSDAGDLPDARTILELTIKNNPKNYNLWLQYIDLRKNIGISNDELRQLFDQAMVATDNYIDIITKYAEFQESVNDSTQAIALWKKAVEKNPENKEIYLQEVARLSQKK